MTTLSNSKESHRIVILNDEGNVLPFKEMNFHVGIDPNACYYSRHVSDSMIMCELAHNVEIDVKCNNGISIKGRWPNISIMLGGSKIGMVRSLDIRDNDEAGKFAHVVLDMAVDLP